MTESDFLAALRRLPLHPGARGLADDAAVVAGLVITSDTLVEGVHFVPGDPAGDVAWKLVATNLSDLAAKGARPEGVLLNYPLSDAAWDGAFLAGLADALGAFACPLVGGDTVTLPRGAPRVLTITALGADAVAPTRAGAQAGDGLWVTGTIGDAGVGLAVARRDGEGARSADADWLLARYRRPTPRLGEGRVLAPLVHAMCDVSDGLLIDAARIAAASGLAATIDLAAVPLSPAYACVRGVGRAARLAAATAGDDYELLFAVAAGFAPPVPATRIGALAAAGPSLALVDAGEPIPLPERLGWLHASALASAPDAP